MGYHRYQSDNWAVVVGLIALISVMVLSAIFITGIGGSIPSYLSWAALILLVVLLSTLIAISIRSDDFLSMFLVAVVVSSPLWLALGSAAMLLYYSDPLPTTSFWFRLAWISALVAIGYYLLLIMLTLSGAFID